MLRRYQGYQNGDESLPVNLSISGRVLRDTEGSPRVTQHTITVGQWVDESGEMVLRKHRLRRMGPFRRETYWDTRGRAWSLLASNSIPKMTETDPEIKSAQLLTRDCRDIEVTLPGVEMRLTLIPSSEMRFLRWVERMSIVGQSRKSVGVTI